MDTSQIFIYPERESKMIEFKEIVPDFKKLVKTCVAYANGAGGEIIIGVEDKSRRIIGVTESDRERIYEDFPNSLYDSVNPVLIPQIYEKSFKDQHVLVIKIWPGSKKPYFIKKQGMPNGIYIRVGASTRQANQQTIEDLSREQKRVTFDEESSNLSEAILSDNLLNDYYGKDRSERRLISDKILVNSPVTPSELSPTHGGILMFCEKPDQYIPEANILCTRFSGTTGRIIIQTEELRGPIPKLAEVSFNLVSNWLERNYRIEEVYLKGESIIPGEALREAIINALIHRKYSIPGAIKIAFYEDRLEIFSPGAFPGLITLSNLGDGTTFIRNHVVAKIARKMRLVEKLGTGIRLILDSCKEAGLKAPEYNEDGDFVKIKFFFEKNRENEKLTSEVILSLVKEKGKIRPRDLSSRYSVSRSTVTRLLAELVNQKKITRSGVGAGVEYYLP